MYVCMYVCMYAFIVFHKTLIKTNLRLLNGETASIYLKIFKKSVFKKLRQTTQKIYHHIDISHFSKEGRQVSFNFNFSKPHAGT